MADPARRTPDGLRLLNTGRRVADPMTKDAQLAGLGIDWEIVPAVLDDAGRTEWRRLAEVFAKDPVRFREGDRAALTA